MKEMKMKYDYDLIRDYLHGIVDSETATEIHSLLANDEIARDIAKGILTMEEIFHADEGEIERYFQKTYSQYFSGSTMLRRRPRLWQNNWLKFAASILIIFVIGYYSINVWSVPNLQAKVDGLILERYPVIVLRSSSPDNEWVNFYSNGQFKNVIEHFESNPTQDPDATFYLGLSHLYTANVAKAEAVFKSKNLFGSRFEEQSTWFLTLVYLKQDKLEQADLQLKEILSKPGHYKSDDAKLLSRILKKE